MDGSRGSKISLNLGSVLSSSELLSGRGLSSCVMVFNLGLTKDNPGVAGRGLVDVGVVDDKEDLLGEHVNSTIRTKICLGKKVCNARSLVS